MVQARSSSLLGKIPHARHSLIPRRSHGVTFHPRARRAAVTAGDGARGVIILTVGGVRQPALLDHGSAEPDASLAS